MKSPFAGMNPYIESSGLWRNFHANLLIKIQDALADLVPRHYLVRAEERSYLLLAVENGKETHQIVLGAGIWIVEGLDLSRARPGPVDFVCLPLRIAGGDGAPARAILRQRRK